jgi:hypothetical protein
MEYNIIEIELNKKENEVFRKIEDDLHEEIDSAKFFYLMDEKFGYNYKLITKFILGGIYTYNEQHEFNIALRKMKKIYDVEIMDSVLYLEKTMAIKNILSVIDGETEYLLKEELSSKYFISSGSNNIFDIMF